MNAEQLRFFYNEVMGLFDWSEDDEAVGIDPLDFIRAELKRLRNKPVIREAAVCPECGDEYGDTCGPCSVGHERG